MDFGIHLNNRGPGIEAEHILGLAEAVDRLGFTSVWVSDHVVIPTEFSSTYPYAAPGSFRVESTENFFEALTTLAVVAGRTRHVRLGTSVLVVPQRNPVLTGKQLATLDALSGGRVIVGAGVGWFAEEFTALAAETFEQRGPATDEYLAVWRALWNDPTSAFNGEHYRLAPSRSFPKPRQATSIPIWIGGNGPAAIRRAARLGDGWHAFRPKPDELKSGIDRLRELTERAGRDPETLTISVRAILRLDGAGGDRDLAGSPSQVQDRIGQLEALGVRHLALDLIPGGRGPSASFDLLDQLAELVGLTA
ncbi:MAG: LLM class F420-dependent oxidoreductase [Chloroflexi bacterium]|nr:LLM class F420-dependent oxidoreductase [Chloroflexota bacterium]